MSEIGVDRATMDAGSAAALYAGSIVLRKTFEAVAQRSVSSIFSSLHARFRGQHQVQFVLFHCIAFFWFGGPVVMN